MLKIISIHSKKNNLDYLALCYGSLVISFDPRVLVRISHLSMDDLREHIKTFGSFLIED